MSVDWSESLSMAVKTLRANRLRSALTMLGIIIGNASVITMVGVGQGAQRLASEQFESLGPNVLFIVPGNQDTRRGGLDIPKTLVLADAVAIATQVPTAGEVAPQVSTRQLVTYQGESSTTQVFGVTPSFLTVRSFSVARGRFFSDLDLSRAEQVAVLGSDLAIKLFGVQNPVGASIRIKGASFRVIGVMEPKGSFLGNNQDDAVYLPLTTVSSRILGTTSPYGIEVSFISVAAKDANSIDAAQFQITNLLRQRHRIIREDDFEVRSQKDVLTIVGTVTNGLTLMLSAIAGISLLVGGIGIMNIMLVSVSERTQEIGLRKAIGATQKDILNQFMIEAVILALLGGAIGTGLGITGVTAIALLTPLKAGVSPVAIAITVTISSGIGLFFGVVPARQAARLDPIVALRSA
ncbi:ABC transporter permease [Synechococcus elongatus]|uniref:Probable ABC transporter permease protein n=2 Tax=Synechococcus elongatus TaxID=32046 RepID=Q31S57_SYNE7|nr:ABC transporter permease [Synechococcus elongatus]ABB56112.1 probable ABC transporter permease protein [Synechococcus elongatus PCC 7942 = FACHB-805]AJD56831.1 ABC transporter permease [Synechococcus elongatus UTEX 2973]MBD2587943.1 ABC transporter permease [Synechococcus elongatus FACHB-242]MBD2689011.1 ABC transporter permease [Synechococcus elongatus FACHB-1061]MBD2707349.1 ABC transporter permease [Synechococcus elongatus PCC 7942 = FACHB-805]